MKKRVVLVWGLSIVYHVFLPTFVVKVSEVVWCLPPLGRFWFYARTAGRWRDVPKVAKFYLKIWRDFLPVTPLKNLATSERVVYLHPLSYVENDDHLNLLSPTATGAVPIKRSGLQCSGHTRREKKEETEKASNFPRDLSSRSRSPLFPLSGLYAGRQGRPRHCVKTDDHLTPVLLVFWKELHG